MKSTLFYKVLRQLKIFSRNDLQLKPLKMEPENRNSVFGKISLIKKRETEALLLNRRNFLDEWKTNEKNEEKSVLFIGPRGSGQVISAGILGNFVGKEVYRIDLSPLASKYIGETEKNLSRVFKEAEGKDWILFFDEADALFGKRSEVKDAHYRYANQEVNYLLQKVKEYSGPVIVSTAYTGLDRQILSRFQLSLQFPLQQKEEENSR